MTGEEQRAADYRAQLVRREAYRRAQYERLAGSPVAAARVHAEWQPLIDALAERREDTGADHDQAR